MYSYINGTLEDAYEGICVIEAYGVGYEINISDRVRTKLPSIGEPLKLYVSLESYANGNETVNTLYGFSSLEEKEMYSLLKKVSGIGPKAALAILSQLEVSDIKFAVLSGDTKSIAAAKGVGKKTAEKLIVELKDKFDPVEALESKLSSDEKEEDPFVAVRKDTMLALTTLGYSNTEALKAIDKVENARELSTSALIKACLAVLA